MLFSNLVVHVILLTTESFGISLLAAEEVSLFTFFRNSSYFFSSLYTCPESIENNESIISFVVVPFAIAVC